MPVRASAVAVNWNTRDLVLQGFQTRTGEVHWVSEWCWRIGSAGWRIAYVHG